MSIRYQVPRIGIGWKWSIGYRVSDEIPVSDHPYSTSLAFWPVLARADTWEPEVANANGRALCEFWLASGDWLAQASRLVRLALASCDWLQHRASGFSIVPMAKRIQASDAGTPERSRQVDHFRRAACRLNVNVRLLAWVILKIWPPLRACKEIVFLFYLSHLSKLWWSRYFRILSFYFACQNTYLYKMQNRSFAWKI